MVCMVIITTWKYAYYYSCFSVNRDLSVRIIIIGDSAVGKSCLLMRFAVCLFHGLFKITSLYLKISFLKDDAFDESHINTIGVDFVSRFDI